MNRLPKACVHSLHRSAPNTKSPGDPALSWCTVNMPPASPINGNSTIAHTASTWFGGILGCLAKVITFQLRRRYLRFIGKGNGREIAFYGPLTVHNEVNCARRYVVPRGGQWRTHGETPGAQWGSKFSDWETTGSCWYVRVNSIHSSQSDNRSGLSFTNQTLVV